MKEQFIAGNGQNIPKHEMRQLLFVFVWLNRDRERAGGEDTIEVCLCFLPFLRLTRQLQTHMDVKL